MTGEQIREYIENDLGCEMVHEPDALANAIEDTAIEFEYDDKWELLWLLIKNYPIDALHTHSYGFHTANGRKIIETIKEKYYEYAK